ncbi:MAG: choice-of-anchor D domain-containing protein [Deltaproteobacteria bacterium]|nr:choice-of-anchor D domain-containing protein [Deltaproteobacteria bacterium]
MKRSIIFSLILMSIVIVGCNCDDTGLTALYPKSEIRDPSGNMKKTGETYELDFGNVVVGSLKMIELEVHNIGESELIIENPTITGSTEFTYKLLLTKINPSAKTYLQITYSPVNRGLDIAKLTINSNDKDNKTITINLKGKGVIADIEVCLIDENKCNEDKTDVLYIDFGSVSFGQESKKYGISIGNTGDYNLNVVSYRIIQCPFNNENCDIKDMETPTFPEFVIEPPEITGEYLGGSVKNFQISYKPVNGGIDKGALEIVSDDPDELKVYIILKGRCIAPRVCPQPPYYIDFGSVVIGQTKEMTFELTSCGTEKLIISKMEYSSTTSNEFGWVETPNIPMELNPPDKYVLKVKYTPKDVGEDNGRIEINTNDPQSPNGYVTVKGEGKEGPSCSLVVDPVELDMGSVMEGKTSSEKAVMLTNKGEIDCNITSFVKIQGPDSFKMTRPDFSNGATIKPGQSLNVYFTYTPSIIGVEQSRWRLTSNDKVRPNQDVVLKGEGTKTLPCSIEATPNPIQFGLVQLGTSKVVSVTIKNVGNQNCLITGLKLDPNSSPTFTIGNFPIPKTLIPNATAKFDVTFKPRDIKTETGKVLVEILSGFLPKNAATIPVSGGGTGPKICVNPKKVEFGIVNIGTHLDKIVEIINCGTAELNVTSIKLSSQSSPDFSIQGAVPTGKYAAGEKKTVTVRYKPMEEGEDKGKLDIASTDAIDPVYSVVLNGYGADPNTQCGNVTGRVCSPGQEIWIGGAKVCVGTKCTISDPDGYFTLSCVPVGNQVVHIEAGSFTTDVPVVVKNRETTDIGAQCVKSNAKIAVMQGQWDQMEHILDDLKLPYTLYPQDDDRVITNINELNKYDILIINCGAIENFDPGVVSNLRNWVAAGNSFMTSDYSYDYFEKVFPNAVDFYGDDNSSDAAQTGGSARGMRGCTAPLPCNIVDQNMVALLGVNQVGIASICWTTMDSAAQNTVIHIEGDVYNDKSMRPVIVSYKDSPNSGKAVYASFHLKDQNAQYMEKIFFYLIFQM